MQYNLGIKYIGLSIICLLLFACENLKDKGYDTKAIAEAVEDRKIKRVTEGHIATAVETQGAKTVQIAQKSLENQFKKAFNNQVDLVEIAKFCAIGNLPQIDSLQKVYKIRIKKISFDNQDISLLNEEKQIIEAYQYNLENKLPLQQNIQKIQAGKQLLYTSPITINSQNCLKCHGQIGKDLTQADWDKMNNKFPAIQNLKNQNLNKSVGMWSVLFSKKEIIRNMDIKTLKKN